MIAARALAGSLDASPKAQRRSDRPTGCPGQPRRPHSVYTLPPRISSRLVTAQADLLGPCSGGMLTLVVRCRALEDFKFPVYPPEVGSGVCCCCRCVSFSLLFPSLLLCSALLCCAVLCCAVLFSCYMLDFVALHSCCSSMSSVPSSCMSLLPPCFA
ncbi:hypothetical protein BO70DRAFT_198767 [Aspergillus heteromorphus CBS 117.55]|uniref:Uncharacterized protein n=1 Tax=Aspergillus heteromorphus CBS 117.55 TaxID=1448321 RepID=A0A317WMX2_9EURO|nr:uncharacterized protein BO70DRAFT_198767 [Aspergillus heteromorphus CBS 117.55]PWY87633.1 hypothetical protein BO70DRAFT_198767 [Aspergillus heteromorphus CBS 117.55]